MAIPPKNIPQTTIPSGSTEYIVSYLDAERRLKDSPVSMMGVSHLVENYVVCRDHTYRWHVVILIRKGELIFRNDEEKNPEIRKFDAGTLLFLPAHSLYTYGTDHELQITWFHLNAESATWHFLRGIGIFYDRSDDKEGFRSLIMLLYREYTLAQRPDANISYFADQLIAHMLERKLKIFVTETEAARKIRNLFETVELSLDKQWTIPKMAKLCSMSQSALFLLSRQCFGQSPMERLNALRMTAAANLLNNSDLKLDAIAAMVGLGCGFSLSRAFKRFYGISPREYKRRTG